MTASLLAQYLVIALAVLVSAGVVMKKQFPGAWRRLRIAFAVPLLREGRPGWLRAAGRRIAPPASAIVGEGGCGGCDGCGPSER